MPTAFERLDLQAEYPPAGWLAVMNYRTRGRVSPARLTVATTRIVASLAIAECRHRACDRRRLTRFRKMCDPARRAGRGRFRRRPGRAIRRSGRASGRECEVGLVWRRPGNSLAAGLPGLLSRQSGWRAAKRVRRQVSDLVGAPRVALPGSHHRRGSGRGGSSPCLTHSALCCAAGRQRRARTLLWPRWRSSSPGGMRSHW